MRVQRRRAFAPASGTEVSPIFAEHRGLSRLCVQLYAECGRNLQYRSKTRVSISAECLVPTLPNNLGKDEALALAVDAAIQSSRMDGWRSNAMKTKKVRLAIRDVLMQAAVRPVEPHSANQSATRDNYPILLVIILVVRQDRVRPIKGEGAR